MSEKSQAPEAEMMGFTIFLHGKANLQMASSVDLVQQYLAHLKMIKDGTKEDWEPVQFMEKDGTVMMTFHVQSIMGVIQGMQAPPKQHPGAAPPHPAANNRPGAQ